MTRAKRFLFHPFVSGLTGGLIVAGAFLIALAVGWVDDGADDERELPSLPAVEESSEGKSAVNRIYERTANGVVFVRATGVPGAEELPFDPFGLPPEPSVATGSGFVIDEDGHVLTNAHVVDRADEVQLTIGDEAESVEAEIVGVDPSTDVAVLKADAEGVQLDPLPLGDSDQIEVGDPAVAIGNPFGLDRTATAGIISALERRIQAPNGFTITDVIQTDAPTNPGNSGGPLLNARAEVVGINSQIATAGGQGSVGIGFAVPVDTVREVVDEILTEGGVQQPFLGLTGADVTDELAEVFDLPVDEGVLVQEVVSGGPADEAGIEGGRAEARIGPEAVRLGGDIIVEVDGEPIDSMEDVIAAVEEREPGEELPLTVIRDGEREDVTAELENRPDRATPDR